MAGGVTARTGTARRPPDDVRTVDTAKGADVVHDPIDLIPVRLAGGQTVCVPGLAVIRQRIGRDDRAVILVHVARVIHLWPGRKAVPALIHGKCVVAGRREILHPGVVAIRQVEVRNRRDRRAVHEQHDPALRSPPLLDLGEGLGTDLLVQKDPDTLPGIGRNRRGVGDIPIHRHESVVCGRALHHESGGKKPRHRERSDGVG